MSFFLLVSASLAVTLCAGMRILHVDARGLGRGAEVTTAQAAGAHLVSRPAPAPTTPLLLEQPGATPGALDVVEHGSRARPEVALTLDADLTAQMRADLATGAVQRYVDDAVIGELRQQQVPATFFLAGAWIEQYPGAARDIGADPLFEVASHSYSDRPFAPGCFGQAPLDLSRAGDDLARAQTLLAGISSHPTTFFRFPGGCYNAEALAAVAPSHVTVVEYDVLSGDASGTDPATIVSHTVAAVRPGSIVELHVTGGKTAPATTRALPAIVSQLRSKGYQLVRLTDLLQPPPNG